MTPLDGTLALDERDDCACFVAKQLHLDMASLREAAFEVYRRIAESRHGFRTRRRYGVGKLGGFADSPHSLATTPGDSLYEEGIADFFSQPRERGVRQVLRNVLAPWDHWDTGTLRCHSRGGFVPHQRDHFRVGPDERQPSIENGGGECLVLGQKPVAGVDGVGPRATRRLDEAVDAKVAFE